MALPTASDNPFPSILITEGTEPAAPAAGKQRLYIDSTSHKLKRTDSSGADVTIEGGASYPFFSRRLFSSGPTNATETLNVNSTSYSATVANIFYHDWDRFPATHFLITCWGFSSESGQTVTFQLTPQSDATNPVSSGGNDLAVTFNGGAGSLFSSGWVAVSDSMSGLTAMTVAVKGSNSTVDFSGRWLDIAFKVT